MQHSSVVSLEPDVIELHPDDTILRNYSISVLGKSPGHVEITAVANPKDAIEYENTNYNISFSTLKECIKMNFRLVLFFFFL